MINLISLGRIVANAALSNQQKSCQQRKPTQSAFKVQPVAQSIFTQFPKLPKQIGCAGTAWKPSNYTKVIEDKKPVEEERPSPVSPNLSEVPPMSVQQETRTISHGGKTYEVTVTLPNNILFNAFYEALKITVFVELAKIPSKPGDTFHIDFSKENNWIARKEQNNQQCCQGSYQPNEHEAFRLFYLSTKSQPAITEKQGASEGENFI